MNRLIVVFTIVLLASCSMAGAQAKNPCLFLTPAEIESVLGIKVSGLNIPGQAGVTQTCSGVAAKRASVILMYANSTQKVADPMGTLEAESRKAANSIGAKMDVKKAGNILCTTLIPPKQGPYTTQCMVLKPPSSGASITVMVATQQEMVSMDKLLLLAQKMSGRL